MNDPQPSGSADTERFLKVRDLAEACAVDATSTGISIAKLKEAAGGDPETYLVGRRNALAHPRDDATGSAQS